MLYIYRRLGKKSGNSEKSRLIKIAVSSIEEKSAVLCNRLKLRNKEHPNHIRKVFITPDMIPLEQQRRKQLRVQLDEMNKSGNLYHIKTGR